MTLTLSLLSSELAVCRLLADAPLPDWAQVGEFYSLTRTADELSLVCSVGAVPEGVRCEAGWRALKVEGPLDFGLTGILAGLAGALAVAGISLFTLSTFDTDYLLVKQDRLPQALAALQSAGYGVAL